MISTQFCMSNHMRDKLVENREANKEERGIII